MVSIASPQVSECGRPRQLHSSSPSKAHIVSVAPYHTEIRALSPPQTTVASIVAVCLPPTLALRSSFPQECSPPTTHTRTAPRGGRRHRRRRHWRLLRFGHRATRLRGADQGLLHQVRIGHPATHRRLNATTRDLLSAPCVGCALSGSLHILDIAELLMGTRLVRGCNILRPSCMYSTGHDSRSPIVQASCITAYWVRRIVLV